MPRQCNTSTIGTDTHRPDQHRSATSTTDQRINMAHAILASIDATASPSKVARMARRYKGPEELFPTWLIRECRPRVSAHAALEQARQEHPGQPMYVDRTGNEATWNILNGRAAA